MRYMLLIYLDPEAESQRDEEETQQILARYQALAKELQDDGRWVGGLRLPERTPKSIRLKPGKGVASVDGPFTETKELLAGFFLIEAQSIDDATAVAARIPGAESGCVEVREVMDLDAMFGRR